MQMLLRVLLPNTVKAKKYSSLRGETSSEVSMFVSKRLSLDFFSIDPNEFLDELFRLCEEKKLIIAPIKKNRATVFISYSHSDLIIVNQLTEVLRSAHINVIVDGESMAAGERISQFMKRVEEVDAIVVIVSVDSLYSPFVGQEINYALKKGIRLIPVSLDKEYLDPAIGDKVQKQNSDHLRKIQQRIAIRKQINPLDTPKELETEETRRRDFASSLGEIIDTLRDKKQINLLDSDVQSGIEKLINEILTSR